MSFYLEIIYAKNNCISKFLTTKTTVDLSDVLFWFLPLSTLPVSSMVCQPLLWSLELISLCTASQNTQLEAQGCAAEWKLPYHFVGSLTTYCCSLHG